MRIVNIKKVKEGDLLGKSVFNEKGELLLAAGYKLDSELINRLIAKGFYSLYIMDELSAGIIPEDIIQDSIRQITNQKIAETFSHVKDNLASKDFSPDRIKKLLSEDPRLLNLVRIPTIRQQVNTLLEEIVDHNIVMFASLPIRSNSGKDYEHALETAILSILIAQKFNYPRRELRFLGSAALLHDIGKVVFGDLRNKKCHEMNRDERMLMREHPTFSMKILSGSEANTFVEQTTILQHHEYANGRGFPQGLKSCLRAPTPHRVNDTGYIYRYAEILSVANAYDNLVSNDTDGINHTPEEALSILIDETGKGMWNSSVVKELVEIVQCYPTGSMIRIKHTTSQQFVGYHAIVKKANPVEQSKPLVVITHNSVGAPINPREFDLAEEQSVSIELLL